MTIKLTEMETRVLIAIDNSEYGDELKDPLWTFSLEGSVPKNSLGGVIGSLSKKGLVDTMEWEENMPVVWMTEKGIEVYKAQVNSTPRKQ